MRRILPRGVSKASNSGAGATRQYGRGAALLSIGIGTTGLVTYGYFSLANHTLSDAAYGGISLLWSAVFMTVSVLYRPVEQLLSRTLAERKVRGKSDSSPLRVAATIQLALAVLFIALALVFRSQIQNDLFDRSETLYWVMFAAVLAYAVSYFARGFLAGSRLFGLYGALVFMEATVRILFALAVAVGIASGMSVVALGIVAGPLISLIVVPWALRRKARDVLEQDVPDSASDRTAAEADDTASGEFSLAHGAGFASAVLIIMVSEQAFLNAGPLIINATADHNGAALAGFVFSLLLVFRAPVQLFQAIATSLLPHLTSMRASKGEDAFKHSVRITVVAIAGFATATTVLLALAGPAIMDFFFPKYEFDRLGLSIVAVGMGLYLTAATLNQAALAQGQARAAAGCWLTAATAFVAWLLLSGIENVGRNVEIGFLGSSTTLCLLLFALYRSGFGREDEDVPRPGSPEELEARLAAADEAS